VGIGGALVDTLRNVARRQGVPTLALADATRNRSASWKQALATLGAASRMRLNAVADALRMVMIPLVCAIVIAIASEDPRGRTLAVTVAFVSVGFGLVVNRIASR
jgi:hypothetical protein